MKQQIISLFKIIIFIVLVITLPMLTKLIIDKYENNKNIYKDEQASYNTIIIEGCEYINVSRLTSHYTHKGNCKNPIHQKRCE